MSAAGIRAFSVRYGVALAACAVVVAVAVLARQAAIRLCGGEFVYPIDDTYIHIAMAKALAADGTWGVESGRLAFCSSSPLWTLVLGGLYAIVGVRETLPWLLALLFNLGAVVLVERTVAAFTDDWRVRLGGTLAVAFAAPFVCTTALGMEHAMHGFFMLAALVASAGIPAGGGRRTPAACLCAAAATGSRYESLFFLLPLGVGLCGLEAWRRWRGGRPSLPWRSAAFLAAAGAPVLVYGAWAIAMGGHFLPNSLLLKGSFRTLPEIVREIAVLLSFVRPGCGFLYVLAAALVVVACTCRATAFWRIASVSAVIAIGGQLLFAGVGQLCRYEAYLTAMGAFTVLGCVVSAGGFGERPKAYAPIAVMCIAGLVFFQRAAVESAATVKASSDIRCQQVLMTRMLAEIPEEDRGCIALNDLGYMALHGGFPFVDIWGLGTQDVTEMLLKHPGTWLRTDIERIFRDHDVRYVAVFERWYPRGLMPEGTEDVAYLTLKDNTTCGADTVVFRATSAKAGERLREHLLKYRDGMPPRVTLRVL